MESVIYRTANNRNNSRDIILKNTMGKNNKENNINAHNEKA